MIFRIVIHWPELKSLSLRENIFPFKINHFSMHIILIINVTAPSVFETKKEEWTVIEIQNYCIYLEKLLSAS